MTRESVLKFAKEIGISSVKMAIASEVAKGIQKGARTVFVKAATMSGMTGPEKSDVPGDDPVFDDVFIPKK